MCYQTGAMAKRSKPAFWEQGLRFECQGSGRCCRSRGPYGYVYVTLADRRRLAAHLGLSTSAFTRRCCERDGEDVYLKHPELDCGFMEGTGCSVYEARPLQCRTWPFWPENLERRVWKREIAPYCPGVGQGRLHTAEEIRAILRLLEQEG